jgi:hypothetical protein
MSLLDQRRSSRFPFHSRGTLQIFSTDYHGTLMDISYHGALFISDETFAFQAGTNCSLNVYYGLGKPFLTLNGMTVQVQKHLVGIEFTALTETVEEALRCLVDLNLGVPQLLDRKLPALLRARV